MSRLIDADALNVYTIVRLVATGEQCENVIYAEDIDNAPTVDAVKVVHCKECRWGHLCVFGQHLGLDGFCSKGERKEQEDG